MGVILPNSNANLHQPVPDYSQRLKHFKIAIWLFNIVIEILFSNLFQFFNNTLSPILYPVIEQLSTSSKLKNNIQKQTIAIFYLPNRFLWMFHLITYRHTMKSMIPTIPAMTVPSFTFYIPTNFGASVFPAIVDFPIVEFSFSSPRCESGTLFHESGNRLSYFSLLAK